MSGDHGVDEMPYLPTVEYSLSMHTLEGRWEEVVKIYDEIPEAHIAMISDSDGTALHVAVESYKENFVFKLVTATIKHNKVDDALQMKNEHGDTPLHVAASRGFARICKFIIGENKERIYLMSLKNRRGETPLFQAAINWKKQAFAYLSHISRDSVLLADLVRDDGDSILHCAIEREFFDLAVIIMHKNYYDFLSTHTNNEGFTPLRVLATRPTAFRSGSNLSWWKTLLYHCIDVAPLEVESRMKWNLKKMEQSRPEKMNSPKNYAKLHNLFSKSSSFLIGNKLPSKKKRDTENPPSNELFKCTDEGGCQLVSPTDHKGKFLPPNYATIQQFVKSAYVHILGLSGVDLKAIKKMKQDHKWGNQLLKALMQNPYSSFTGVGGRPESIDEDMFGQFSKWKHGNQGISTNTPAGKSETLEEGAKLLSLTGTDSKEGLAYKFDITKKIAKSDNKIDRKETPFLVAASNGIVEMVNEILNLIPSAIHNTNTKKQNVLLLAVINRHPFVVETIRKRMKDKEEEEVWNNLILGVDEDENTMLHLAAEALSQGKPWQMSGSTLQMMWDITWFQYIKSLVPQHFYFRSNKQNKTVGEIFRESHQDLFKDSGNWLKDTSESCSVVAALVAGVSFATASAVPGDYNDEGKPTLEGYTAFNVFAISSLIGLCFSITGLIMFLSVLTSRKEARDFRRDLPIKLLLGLSSIFVSITAMFVSFCNGHVFLLNSKYRTLLIPIYAATSLPVTLYAIAQFPLYIDLLAGIFTKLPMRSDRGSWRD